MTNTTPEGTQAASSETTPGGQSTQTTTTPEPQAGDGSPEQISIEEARKLRREAQQLRQRLKTFEEAEAAQKAAQLTETERLQQQYAKLQTEHTDTLRNYQERLVRYEIEKQAAKVGIRPEAAEDAVKLLDWSALEFDEDGSPKNAAELLKQLLKAKPYLAAAPQPQQAATPAVPAMNPGRASLAAPNKVPGKIPRLYEVWSRK